MCTQEEQQKQELFSSRIATRRRRSSQEDAALCGHLRANVGRLGRANSVKHVRGTDRALVV